jgi:hypothetical protein
MQDAHADAISAAAMRSVAVRALVLRAMLAAFAFAVPAIAARAEGRLLAILNAGSQLFECYKSDGAQASFNIDIAEAPCTIFGLRRVHTDVPWVQTIPMRRRQCG